MENNSFHNSTMLNYNKGNRPKIDSIIKNKSYMSNSKIDHNFKTYKGFPKLSTIKKSSSYFNLKNPKIEIRSFKNRNSPFKLKEYKVFKKELSVKLFQNNDIDLVRSLNLDSENDLCSNLLLKEKLKNKFDSKFNLSLLFNSNKN